MEEESDQIVYLLCVKEKRKLRMKIISPGYHKEANCQCPRDIRIEGMKYTVNAAAIKFVEGPASKYFYRISGAFIKPLEDSYLEKFAKNLAIYEDTSSEECIICMSNTKDTVFATCGHYMCCGDCCKRIFQTTKKCPVCRSEIIAIVKRESVNCG
jgi:hypothetical protein